MALIKCPECGKEISDRASACIHCGCPLASNEPVGGKIIIKAQTNPVDVTARQMTFDIFTSRGKLLCTIEPGGVKTIEIDSDVEIFAKPTYGFDFAKDRRKTNSIRISNNKTTRVHLAFVPYRQQKSLPHMSRTLKDG